LYQILETFLFIRHYMSKKDPRLCKGRWMTTYYLFIIISFIKYYLSYSVSNKVISRLYTNFYSLPYIHRNSIILKTTISRSIEIGWSVCFNTLHNKSVYTTQIFSISIFSQMFTHTRCNFTYMAIVEFTTRVHRYSSF